MAIPASTKPGEDKQAASTDEEIPEPTNDENNLDDKVSKEPINDDKDSASTTKDSLNSSVTVEEDTIKVESNHPMQPSEQSSSSQSRKESTDTESKPSGVFGFFNSLLDFMKKMFKWW